MFFSGWMQIAFLALILFASSKPLGIWLYAVLERTPPFDKKCANGIERFLYRLGGIDPTREQTWYQYACSVVVFTVLGIVILLMIQLTQCFLPLNPEKRPSVEFWLALNTAVSFATNTNWQSYAGETTMSPLTQMVGLAWQNFVSAATGLAVAFAFMRGLTRRRDQSNTDEQSIPTLGNFYVDLVRGTIYVLFPLAFVGAILFLTQGIPQNFSTSQSVQSLEGDELSVPTGPVASQESIKLLGTNGGGFFNANSAHPMENPTPLSNFLQILLMLLIPSALTYSFGLMSHNTRNGWVLWGTMFLLLLFGTIVVSLSETGNMEGKEVRFGTTGSALYATVTTGTSCGAVNSMHDSFRPISGLVLMLNMQLGEIVFGGVGSGLYGMLVFVLLTVFIAGLMVGRTPEFLGKKIEAYEMKLIVCFLLVSPVLILGFSACSSVAPWALASLNNEGPHGFSEILYAYTSAAANNGSAFAGLSANTVWYNVTIAIAMFLGRMLCIVPVLAIAGSMVAKKTVPTGAGTLPTDNAIFLVLLLGTILIVGALTFFPALVLGPVLEFFQ